MYDLIVIDCTNKHIAAPVKFYATEESPFSTYLVNFNHDQLRNVRRQHVGYVLDCSRVTQFKNEIPRVQVLVY